MADILIKTENNNKVVEIKNETVSISNRNLLDNPWFTVNQRGVSGGQLRDFESYTDYYLDRWYLGGVGANQGSYTYTDGILTMSPANARVGVRQKIEDYNSLKGKTLTGSILLSDGTIYSGTFVKSESDETQVIVEIPNVFRLRFLDINAFDIDCFSQISIRAVKLELGNVSTLVNDIAPDYGEELRKCQRYYFKLSNFNANGFCSYDDLSRSQYHIYFELPVVMRTIPTISTENNPTSGKLLSSIRSINGEKSASAANVTSISSALCSENHIGVDFSLSQSIGITAGTPCAVRITGSFIFSADLYNE